MDEYTAMREIETDEGYEEKEVTFNYTYHWDWSDSGTLSPITEIVSAKVTETGATYRWSTSDEDEVQEHCAENIEYPEHNFDLLNYG